MRLFAKREACVVSSSRAGGAFSRLRARACEKQFTRALFFGGGERGTNKKGCAAPRPLDAPPSSPPFPLFAPSHLIHVVRHAAPRTLLRRASRRLPTSCGACLPACTSCPPGAPPAAQARAVRGGVRPAPRRASPCPHAPAWPWAAGWAGAGGRRGARLRPLAPPAAGEPPAAGARLPRARTHARTHGLFRAGRGRSARAGGGPAASARGLLRRLPPAASVISPSSKRSEDLPGARRGGGRRCGEGVGRRRRPGTRSDGEERGGGGDAWRSREGAWASGCGAFVGAAAPPDGLSSRRVQWRSLIQSGSSLIHYELASKRPSPELRLATPLLASAAAAPPPSPLPRPSSRPRAPHAVIAERARRRGCKGSARQPARRSRRGATATQGR